MGKFKQYLRENEDLFNMICDMLSELSEEEIHAFGEFLFDVYDEIPEDEQIEFEENLDVNELKEIIKELGENYYEELIYFLQPDDFEDEEEVGDTSDHEEHHAIGENVNTKKFKKKRKIWTRRYKKLNKNSLDRQKKINKMFKGMGSRRRATKGGGSHRMRIHTAQKKINRQRKKRRINN